LAAPQEDYLTMTTEELPTLPDRDRLRALYDTAVNELNQARDGRLTTDFYAKTGDAVFDACYLALSDSCRGTKGPRRVNVVSAPAGGGKTSFSYAFMAALTRYAEMDPKAPQGCVLVVDQIRKADEAYRELDTLMSGKVAVWSSEHDRGCKTRTKVPSPAAEFTQDELRNYAVIVVTHAFYNGRKGHKAHLMKRGGRLWPHDRALVIVDERPEEVTIYETTLAKALDLRDKLVGKRPDINEPMGRLLTFMTPNGITPINNNRIERPSEHFGQPLVANHLQWFATKEAEDLVKAHANDAEMKGLDQLFGFAKALTQGCAFYVAQNQITRFVGWQSKLMVRPGTVLLDATADIDGVTNICPWRKHTKVPQAHYSNLEIIHVPQLTKRRLGEYLKTAPNKRAYVQHVVDTIRAHMLPGERGLVICKKSLIEEERLPNWPEGDPRFKDPDSYTKRYDWEIEGRHLCVTHWGTGIGSNDWKDADVVFLFDEFFIPRRVSVAQVQGLNQHQADQGALGAMKAINSKSSTVDLLADGHRLRWTKQLALRGRGRSYDERGNCGKQRLVISSDLKSFTANAPRLFPGAKITVVGDCADGERQADQLIRVLSNPELPPKLRTKEVSALIGKPWRSVSANVLTPEFVRSLTAIGWRYVPQKGRGGGYLERTTPDHALAA
jgi:hypothetical protein